MTCVLRWWGRWVVAAFVLAAAGSVSGHEQQSVLTTVEVNERTRQVEVVHRFLLHDVEHAIGQFDWGPTDVLANATDRERFGRYVSDQFGLQADAQPVPLNRVGQELDGRYLFVYQEGPLPRPATTVTVVNHILGGPNRHHLVNVRLAGIEGSMVFETGVTELTLAQSR